MNQGQKIVTVSLWAVLVIVMVGVIGAGAWDRLRDSGHGKPGISATMPAGSRPAAEQLEDPWQAPAFALTDQDGKAITDQSLRGHPYIAAFVFTQCAGPCPLITGKMAQLQTMVHNPAVKLVSFSVDPMHDTPAVLKQYANQFKADPARWYFLTGKEDDVYAVAKGMKMALQPAEPISPIIHSTRLLLVDGGGKVRGIYSTGEHSDADTLDRLAHDADQLAGEKTK